MEAIKAKVRGAFVSFKWEKDQRYHRTYELPPKTTLFGFIGAALGLKEEEVYHDWEWGNSRLPLSNRVRVAVLLDNIKGRIKDTWTTIKNVPAKGRIERRPITREQLFQPSYTIYIQSEDFALLKQIKNRLEAPAFPLSLGRDDELVRIESVIFAQLEKAEPPILLYGILLPFDIAKVKKKAVLEGALKPHLVQKLPHRFEIINKTRNPREIREFTFLTGYKVSIEEPIDAYHDPTEGRNVVFL